MKAKCPITAALLASTLLAAYPATAEVTAAKGFRVEAFGKVPAGLTNPDSTIVLDNHVWIGYGDKAPPDGSRGTSNVVAYTMDGSVAFNLTMKGHNDGLRFDPYSKKLWAVQNEDASPQVVFIDPKTGAQTPPLDLKPVNGGGYDDEAFVGGKIYVSASNPALNAKGRNVHPAVVSMAWDGRTFVPETVLMGNSPAINTVTGLPAKLNLTDPDSLTVTPDNDLLLDDQGDAQVILLNLHNGKGPYISQIPLAGGVQVDDTVYATTAFGSIFVSDTAANTTYKITSKQWHIGKPYTASTGVPKSKGHAAIPSFVGELFLDSGATVPVVTGLQSAHGMIFMPH